MPGILRAGTSFFFHAQRRKKPGDEVHRGFLDSGGEVAGEEPATQEAVAE